LIIQISLFSGLKFALRVESGCGEIFDRMMGVAGLEGKFFRTAGTGFEEKTGR
jgi:hypothetical protein